MLLKQTTLRRIADGSVTLAFRRWTRPTVKTGGTLLTTIGQLSIEAVDPVDIEDIDEKDARAAGFDDLESLRVALLKKTEGSVYRVALRLAGPDPRIVLREEIPESPEDFQKIRARLARSDEASPSGPWTQSVLQLLERRPAVGSAHLATEVDMDKARFKTYVRRLKGLGLTESLEVGYRLSPRGEAVLRFVEEFTD